MAVPTSDGEHTRNWELLALRVRLALAPDEPRVLHHFLKQGENLPPRSGRTPVSVNEFMAKLLLDTAADTTLPLHWRMQCLDHCYRPLQTLASLLRNDTDAQRLRNLSTRLARFHLIIDNPENTP